MSDRRASPNLTAFLVGVAYLAPMGVMSAYFFGDSVTGAWSMEVPPAVEQLPVKFVRESVEECRELVLKLDRLLD